MVRSAAEVLAASRTSIVGRVPKLADRIPPGLVLRNFLHSDIQTGKRYIGSAYGDQGIWSRWCSYIARAWRERGVARLSERPHAGVLPFHAQRGSKPASAQCRTCLKAASAAHSRNLLLGRASMWMRLPLSPAAFRRSMANFAMPSLSRTVGEDVGGILQHYANAYSIEPSFVCSQAVQVALCGAGLLARCKFWRRCGMDEKITSKMLSRRKAFSVLVAAFGLAVPTVALTGSDAEAQTVGMQRRHERRTGRHERRTDRRTGRTERREDRRTGGDATVDASSASIEPTLIVVRSLSR